MSTPTGTHVSPSLSSASSTPVGFSHASADAVAEAALLVVTAISSRAPAAIQDPSRITQQKYKASANFALQGLAANHSTVSTVNDYVALHRLKLELPAVAACHAGTAGIHHCAAASFCRLYI